MKKLALYLDSLDVESFDTIALGRDARGTVHGLGTEMTICWGLCGQATAGLCGPGTGGGYTYDAYAMDCISYAVPCDATLVPTNCASENTCAETGCRDSVTAC